MPDIQLEERGEIAIVRPRGPLVAAPQIKLLESTILSCATKKGIRKFLVNMTDVDWINSSGLVGLIHLHREILNRPDDRFVLFGLTDITKNIFRISKLDSVFDIHPTEEEALAALQPASV